MLAPAQRRRVVVTFLRRGLVVVAALAAVGGVVWAFLPAVLPVDMATVVTGPLVVAVREEGKTRIKDRYVVSSPLTGRVLRIALDPGDPVERGQTILAMIEPALLDARALAQAQANVKAAEASLERSQVNHKRTQEACRHAESQFRRIRSLRETGTASPEEYEDVELIYNQCVQEEKAAQFNVSIAEYELEQARAALLRAQPADDVEATEAASVGSVASEPGRMEIRSPITGKVLRVFQESAAVVTSGTPLVEVGDPRDLEVVVDVLSEDAVKIQPHNRVAIEQWGGSRTLKGHVRRIEPQAFTKVSALGVEEQRVNIIIDFDDPPEERTPLGDGYRVEAQIVIWEESAVTKVPTSTLFRRDNRWTVFVVENGQARLQPVELGQRNSLEAEVLEGLEPGQVVIIHPSDEVQEGRRVQPRG